MQRRQNNVPLPTVVDANSTTLTLPPDAERHIRERWQHWEPLATQHYLASNPTSGGRVERMNLYRAAHRAAAIDAIRANISWRMIMARDLDDPRLSPDDRRKALAAAIERRRCLANRNKNNVNVRYNRNQSKENSQ